MGDPTRGLYRKFVVRRVDGTDAAGGKHDGCEYFVLDLTHDPHAPSALKAYADSCRKEYPLLARDLDAKVAVVGTAPQEQITGETSDGYHTFNELYAYRKAYNAALFNEWARRGLYDVHKSWRHSDGELCFGGGWFIVVAETPAGQISNHYKTEDWALFACAERERSNLYDGHTPQIALQRLFEVAASPSSGVGTAPPTELVDLAACRDTVRKGQLNLGMLFALINECEKWRRWSKNAGVGTAPQEPRAGAEVDRLRTPGGSAPQEQGGRDAQRVGRSTDAIPDAQSSAGGSDGAAGGRPDSADGDMRRLARAYANGFLTESRANLDDPAERQTRDEIEDLLIRFARAAATDSTG